MEYYKIYQVLIQKIQDKFKADHIFSSQMSLI